MYDGEHHDSGKNPHCRARATYGRAPGRRVEDRGVRVRFGSVRTGRNGDGGGAATGPGPDRPGTDRRTGRRRNGPAPERNVRHPGAVPRRQCRTGPEAAVPGQRSGRLRAQDGDGGTAPSARGNRLAPACPATTATASVRGYRMRYRGHRRHGQGRGRHLHEFRRGDPHGLVPARGHRPVPGGDLSRGRGCSAGSVQDHAAPPRGGRRRRSYRRRHDAQDPTRGGGGDRLQCGARQGPKRPCGRHGTGVPQDRHGAVGTGRSGRSSRVARPHGKHQRRYHRGRRARKPHHAQHERGTHAGSVQTGLRTHGLE